MRKKTVYILQDTKEQVELLKSEFDKSEEFEVLGYGIDAINALSLITDKTPDYLITELVIKGYDGISVIRKVKELGARTKIIVLSSITREEVIARVMASGANYFMARPVNMDVLKERMLELGEEKAVKSDPIFHDVSLDEKISKIFINVGIPPHIKGYSFLREGVKMAVAQPDIINSITKKLYPKIGEKYETSASKVERAIRHAIEVAWNRGRIDSINSILGVRAYVGSEKPTNGEFIALVADKMILEKA